MNPAEAEVWAAVQALNRAWTMGHVDDLADHFHHEMIAITPTDRDRLEGREECVAAWRRFAVATTIKNWRETYPVVRIYGDAAVVAYRYKLECEMDGQQVTLAGRDMFFFVREDGWWVAAADQFSGIPGSGVSG